jgi:hypothetical protein
MMAKQAPRFDHAQLFPSQNLRPKLISGGVRRRKGLTGQMQGRGMCTMGIKSPEWRKLQPIPAVAIRAFEICETTSHASVAAS